MFCTRPVEILVPPLKQLWVSVFIVTIVSKLSTFISYNLLSKSVETQFKMFPFFSYWRATIQENLSIQPLFGWLTNLRIAVLISFLQILLAFFSILAVKLTGTITSMHPGLRVSSLCFLLNVIRIIDIQMFDHSRTKTPCIKSNPLSFLLDTVTKYLSKEQFLEQSSLCFLLNFIRIIDI